MAKETSATVNEILSILGLTEVTNELKADGIVVDYYQFSRIIEAIRSIKGYSEVRGHVWYQKLYNVSYSSNFFSYERLDNSIFIDSNVISYDKEEVETFKVFVSDFNWIDLHINYSEKSYATMVFVPKNEK